MSINILIVDDDINILHSYKRMLRKLGNIDIAESGAAALEMMEEKGPYAVVLADQRMPVMDGVGFLSLAAERYPDTIRILITGYADLETALNAINKGNIYNLLRKPCPEDILIDSVKSGVEKYLAVIDERNSAREALNESEERYRLLADNVLDVIWTMDEHFTWTYISPSIKELTGFSPGEFLSMSLDSAFAPGYSKKVRKHLRNLLASYHDNGQNTDFFEKSSHTLELEFNRKDSGTVFAETLFSLVQNAGDSLPCFVGIARNISERKQAEKEKELLEAHLRYVHKMQAIGMLAGGIAHDFNNILSPIIGFTEMTMYSMTEGSMERQDLQEVLSAAHRARELVRQMLIFSSSDKGVKTPMKIHLAINGVVKLAKALFPATITINSMLDKDCPEVICDATQMEQVFLNLFTNASKSMEEMGGSLNIRLYHEKNTENHTEKNPDGFAVIEIRDSGRGMQPEVVEKAFKAYYSGEESPTSPGLGFAVVRRIIEQHGGTITLTSSLGQGTEFVIRLPVVRQEPEKEEVLAPAPSSDLRGSENILFVDDEKTVTHVARQLLENLGYNVTITQSSNEAYNLVLHSPEKFDVVITDVIMPDMGGKELAGKITEINPDIPVVLCSGYFSDDIEKGPWREEFIQKPLILAELAGTIRKVVAK